MQYSFFSPDKMNPSTFYFHGAISMLSFQFYSSTSLLPDNSESRLLAYKRELYFLLKKMV